MSGSLSAGKYKIVPGGAALSAPSNYVLVYKQGTLVVSKPILKATVRDTSRIYGDPNPAFTISYNGFLNGDNPTKIIPPVASSSATVTTPVGQYPITLTGGSAVNYTIQNSPGTLTIGPAALNVMANDQGISTGDNLPVFTSTITGFKNGESNSIISGPSYSLPPNYVNTIPGTYPITPYGLHLTYQNNYTITYQPGTLYVNDNNGKNVVPKLDCVEPLTNDPSGLPYAAHFSYNNPNATPVFVALGSNNILTTSGRFSGQPPTVFLVGSGQFKIYFDGSKMTWTLITYNGNHKSSTAAVASSTSSKCSSGTITNETGVQSGVATAETVADSVAEPAAEPVAEPASSLYPNPTKGPVTIYIKDGIISSNNVQLSDSYGKVYKLNARLINNHSLQMDLSRLSSGMYFIRVKVGNDFKTFRVLKM